MSTARRTRKKTPPELQRIDWARACRVRVQRRDRSGGRDYRIDIGDEALQLLGQLRLGSTTHLLKAMDKPALVPWASRNVATAAMANLPAITQMVPEDAIDWLAGSARRYTKGRANIGTAVHALIEWEIARRTGQILPVPDVDPELEGFVEQFADFLDLYRPRFAGAEMTVFHPEDGWAGTLDTIAQIEGREGWGVIDVKTSNPTRDGAPGVYPEYALQLACYAHARLLAPFRERWGRLIEVPPITWGAVLWLRPDRWALVEVDVSDATYEAFLNVARVSRWVNGPGRDAVIGSVAPPDVAPLPQGIEAWIASIPARAA